MREHEFILNYAKTDPAPEPRDTALKIDWSYIIGQANRHRITPLLYNNLKNHPVPVDILKKMKNIYTYTAFHNMLYLDELQAIIDKTEQAGIKLIILKGPMLAQNVYGNIALRPFADMDILVSPQDRDRMEAILEDRGYIAADKSFYKKYHFHLPLTKSGKMPVHLELHWSFVDKFIIHRIDMDMVWKKTKHHELAVEINILYLLLHIEKHAFFNKFIYNSGNARDWIFTNPCGNQLLWYTDLYELISKNNIDWQQLINLARNYCIAPLVYYNLQILGQLYPLALPADLPQPVLSAAKRFIYHAALKKTSSFKMSPDLQLRPVRAVDLVNYLLPAPEIINKYYCHPGYIPSIITYIFHLVKGIKEILKELVGICRQKLSINKGRGSLAVN